MNKKKDRQGFASLNDEEMDRDIAHQGSEALHRDEDEEFSSERYEADPDDYLTDEEDYD